MAVQVAHPKPQREIPEPVREKMHEQLDRMIGQYVNGYPMPMQWQMGFSGSHVNFEMQIIFKGWY